MIVAIIVIFVLKTLSAYNFSSWEGILKMDSRITTSSDTGSETFIRYYIPFPVATLASIFSRMMDNKVQGNKTTLCPKPLGSLLRYYEIQDRSAGGYFHDIPAGSVAWQLVTLSSSEHSDREPRVDSEGPLHIIADEVISMETLAERNPQVFESLKQDGYIALARNGKDTFIPLRNGDVVTNRSFQVIFDGTTSCREARPALTLP
jgi:hypothetical protein